MNALDRISLLTLPLCILLLAGCGGSSSSSTTSGGASDPTNIGADSLGYDPQTRWPDGGSYTYQYSESINGSRCEARKSYVGKAAYCTGLQDQTANDHCALAERKNDYRQACGEDFQELNVSTFQMVGFDPYLQKNCATAKSSAPTFKTVKDLCSFLRDESQHNQCFWEERHQRFLSKNCAGGFSVRPAKVTAPPAQSPFTPAQTQPSGQISDPVLTEAIANGVTSFDLRNWEQAPIVQELRRNGIQVDVFDQAILHDGRTGYRPQTKGGIFAAILKELEANKDKLIARKSQISQITISSYTAYRQDPSGNGLTLDYEIKSGELSEYLPLFDQLIGAFTAAGMHADFIHSGYTREKQSYEPLREAISFFKKNSKELKSLSGLVSEIKFDSYADYTFSLKKLSVRESDPEKDLAKFVQLLKPLAPVADWAKKNQIEIDADFDIEKDTAYVHRMFQFLQTGLRALDLMKSAGMLKEIDLHFFDSEQNYFSSSQKLGLALGSGKNDEISKAIATLGKIAKRSLEIRRPILVDGYDLDDDFYKSFSLLETLWPKILAKSSKIQTLMLAYGSRYDASSKELRLGSSSTVRETETVLSEIK